MKILFIISLFASISYTGTRTMTLSVPFDGNLQEAEKYVQSTEKVDPNLMIQTISAGAFDIAKLLLTGKDDNKKSAEIIPTPAAIQFNEKIKNGTIIWKYETNQYVVPTDVFQDLPLKNPRVAQKYLGSPLYLPLHDVAAMNESQAKNVSKFIKWLVSHANVNPNIVEPYRNRTALHCALLSGSPTIIESLLEYNLLPSLNIEDCDGQTPLKIAQENKRIEELLNPYLGKYGLSLVTRKNCKRTEH